MESDRNQKSQSNKLQSANHDWSKYTLLRIIGLSLGVLSIGLAIAIIGYLLSTAK